MRRACLFLFVLAVLAALESCASPSVRPDAKPILIGMYADLSSTGARDGNDAVKGAQLRIKEANAAGGIDGRQVTLKTLDVKQSPTEAVKAFSTLAQEDQAYAVIGCAVANAGLTVSPVGDLAKVPLISLSIDDRVTLPELKLDNLDAAARVRQYTFLVQPSACQLASAMAAYAADHFPQRRYATLFDPANPVSALQAKSFESTVKNAGKVIAASKELPPAAADYTKVLAEIRSADVEALYVCGTSEQNFAVALEMKNAAFRPVLLGNQAWLSPVLDRAGYAVDGVWFCTGIAPDDPVLEDLRGKFQAQYGDSLRPTAVQAWDAVGLILETLRKAGAAASPLSVRDGLEQMTGFKSAVRQLDMDRKTHRLAGETVAVMRIAEGRYMTVDPRYAPKPAKGR